MGTEQLGIAEVVAETMVAVETIARALRVKDARLEPTLDAIVTNAAATHPAASDAGVTLLIRGKLVPQATTGRPPQILDLRQQVTGKGPCVEAASRQTVICISDTSDDARWPDFCAAAQACGVHSMLCAPLWVDEACMGTLTLYSQQAGAFGPPDIKLIAMFGALAALSLAEAQRTANLREAMVNRDLIGQAKGILMERYKVDGETAIGILSRASQALNLKLAAIARHLAESGELLGPAPT